MKRAFEEAAAEKLTKYEDLRKEFTTTHQGEVIFAPFVVGSLGSWDPSNDALVKRICSRYYGKLMRKLCVSETIGFSRDIYVEHITGTRKRVI